eukprot:scaffold8085_cov154-Skeletonema_menzelii.AAC.1
MPSPTSINRIIVLTSSILAWHYRSASLTRCSLLSCSLRRFFDVARHYHGATAQRGRITQRSLLKYFQYWTYVPTDQMDRRWKMDAELQPVTPLTLQYY